MKWTTIAVLIVAAIAVAAAIAALIGMRLPRSHHASGERVVDASPEALWPVLTDIDHKQFTIERMDPPRLLVTRVRPGQPFGGTWTYEIAPAANGTRVKITEDGEIYNPLFRFMARYIIGYQGTINGYLAGLEKRFNTHGA
jgi:hypothetical protein